MLADYCKSNSIRLLIASLPELHDVSHIWIFYVLHGDNLGRYWKATCASRSFE